MINPPNPPNPPASSCGYHPVDISESGATGSGTGTGVNDPLLPQRDKKCKPLSEYIRVRTFCLFFPLRIGAITAAIISTMLVIFMAVSAVMMLIRALTPGIRNLPFPEQQYPLGVKKTLDAIQVLGGVQFVLTAVSGLLLIVFIIGIWRRKASYISLWLVWDIIFIFSATAASAFGIASGDAVNVLTCLVLGYKLYLWVVSLSYIHEISETNKATAKV